MLLYLPLAHNFGRCSTLLGAHIGYTIAFCPDPYAVGALPPCGRPSSRACRACTRRCTLAVTAKFDEATGVKRRLIDWALRVGGKVSKLRESGVLCL
jgi:hypothetical protein